MGKVDGLTVKMKHDFLLLGGYGNAGRQIARLLLENTDSTLVIAGRNSLKADQLSGHFNDIFPGKRVRGLGLDAADASCLREALKGISMLIVASSTASLTGSVAETVLECGCDYMDIQFSHEKIRILRILEDRIDSSGSCFITDGGYHPGLPAVLVRYAAGQMESIKEAIVGAVMNINWKAFEFSAETITEFAHELRAGTPLVFRKDTWKKASWGGMFDLQRMDFGQSNGIRKLFPMFLEEMRNLPSIYPDLRRTGFYIGGMDWFSNWISFPLGMTWYGLFPQSDPSWIPKLMFWGMKKFSKPPFHTRIRLESRGENNGQPAALNMSLSHPDAYVFTAAPVIACLKQYIEGRLKKPGLFTQAEIVDPDQFISDLRSMGMEMVVERPEFPGHP